MALNAGRQRSMSLSEDKPGEEKTDLTLSDDRAKAVLDALVAKGVKKEILISKGFGETQPIAPNDTEDGREKNRRVDFVIVDPAPPKTTPRNTAPPNGATIPKPTNPKPAANPKPPAAGKK
jgi:OOP family OmpA-OmpF porin